MSNKQNITRLVLDALRVGRSLKNPTPFAWVGVAATFIGLVVSAGSMYAQSRGLIDTAISVEEAIAGVGLFAASLLAQLVSSDKVGALPDRKPKEQ